MKKYAHQLITYSALSLFGLVLVLYPGQNDIQLLTISPQVRAQKYTVLDIKRTQIPIQIGSRENQPNPTARAVFVVDTKSGIVLFEKNADAHFMPASTTKIMTALTAMQLYSLDEIITIKDEDRSIGSKSDLIKGEQITVRNAIQALLISSGNDAALALGQHDPQGYSHFIDEMNQNAKKWHLTNSHFTNVSGVEQPDHYVSARDLATLAKIAMKNEFIRSVVNTKKITIKSADGQISHSLENTNELLETVPGVNGIKTGWTTIAGECLVTSVQRNGHEIITVVLDSKDRFGESRELIEWVYANFNWQAFPLELVEPLPVPTLD